jgi:AraC-like DNA-binding protein
LRLRRYRAALRDNYSNTARLELDWLGWLTLAMAVQFGLWLPISLAGLAWAPVLDIGRLVILYLLGWFGMRQASVLLPPPVAVMPTEQPAKYARSGMTDEAAALIGQRLVQRMTLDRIYQEPELTLATLAARIGTSPQLLSQYLNDVLGVSFFDYVNRARIEAVQALLRDEAHQQRTLLDLAFMVGFNSKSAFNASFKRVTGMTPTEWRKMTRPEVPADRPGRPLVPISPG